MAVKKTEIELKADRLRYLNQWREGASIRDIAIKEKFTVPEMKSMLLQAVRESGVTELRKDKK